MTTNPESKVAGTEPVQPPTAPVSDPVSVQPSGSPDVDAIVEALVPKVLTHPDYLKDKQSVKDKRFAKIENQIEAQDDNLGRLASKLGVTLEDLQAAQNSLVVEDMVRDYQSGAFAQVQPTTPPSNVPGGTGLDLAVARQNILQQVGLPETHPGIDDMLAQQDWSNPVQATLNVTSWAAQQVASLRNRSPADTAPPVTTAPEPGLMGEYKEKLSNMRRGDVRSITKLQMEYRKKGLDI